MNRTTRAAVGSVLCAGLLASCETSVAPGSEADDFDFAPTTLERGIGFGCAGADICSGATNGATEVFRAAYRIGATPTSRGVLLQTFTAPRQGPSGEVSFQLSALRPVNGFTPIAHVQLFETSGAARADVGTTPLAQGTAPIPAAAGVIVVPLTGATLQAGHTYAFVLFTDAPPVTSAGTVLDGVAAVVTSNYADGQPFRRGERTGSPVGAFRSAGAADVLFAFNYGDHNTTVTADALALVSGDGQQLARQVTSAPLIVRSTAAGAPVQGQSVTFTITAGEGSLSLSSAVTQTTVATDASGNAQVSLTTGTVTGTTFVSVDDGLGHSQLFAVSTVDLAPVLVNLTTTLSDGSPATLESVFFDRTVPLLATNVAVPAPVAAGATAPFTTNLASITATPLTAVAAPVEAGAPTALVDAPAVTTENVTLTVTPTLAAGTQTASVAYAADSSVLPGTALDAITASSPTSVTTFTRGDVGAGPLKVSVAATDGGAGPLDVTTASLPTKRVRVKQAFNINGGNIDLPYNDLIPVAPDTVYAMAYADPGQNSVRTFLFTPSTNTLTPLPETNPGGNDDPVYLGHVGSTVYLVATTSDGSRQIFKVVGTTQVQVPPIAPGYDASSASGTTLNDSVSQGVDVGGALYFSNSDVNAIQRLMWTDGSQPQAVPDITDPTLWMAHGNKVIVVANSETSGVTKLWAFDGAGLTQISNLSPDNSDSISSLASYGGDVYFAGVDANGLSHVYRWDNDAVSQPFATNPGSSEDPNFLTPCGSKLFFTAFNASGVSRLYKWDGTTVALATAFAASTPDNATSLTCLGSTLWYFGRSSTGATKLFKTDGTTVTQIPDPASGIRTYSPGYHRFTTAGSNVYFVAQNTSRRNKLYRSDGVSTTLVADITGPINADDPIGFYTDGSRAVFQMRDAAGRAKFFSVSGTAAPVQAPDTLAPFAQNVWDDLFNNPTVVNGRLYFFGYNGAYQLKVMSFDGSNVRQVSNQHPSGPSDDAGQLTALGTRLYLRLSNYLPTTANTLSSKLFSFDGTTLTQLSALNSTTQNDVFTSAPTFAAVGNTLFFSGMLGPASHLYSYDGGTVRRLSSLTSGTELLTNLLAVGNSVYFTANGSTGIHLHEFTGTTISQRTALVLGSDTVQNLVEYNGDLYFGMGETPTTNATTKLYRLTSTTLTRLSNTAGTGVDDMVGKGVVAGGTLYVPLADPSGNRKLYAWDGTTLNQVADINPGGTDEPTSMTSYAGSLWFSGQTQTGTKLFRYDGTRLSQMSDLSPGGDDVVTSLIVYDNELYFQGLYTDDVTGSQYQKVFRLCEPAAGCTP